MASIDQPLLAASAADDAVLAASASRLAAYVSLTKPRLVLMVLVTVAVGFLLGAAAARPRRRPLRAGGDALGHRTGGRGRRRTQPVAGARARRPDAADGESRLPSGRLTPSEAAVFGSLLACRRARRSCSSGPTCWRPRSRFVTFLLYVFVYTPLKTRTTLNTVIGAVPGALPPVIGWAAATGRLGIEAWALFLIVFLWQFPHFLAIAWIYRDDYQRAGFRMLTAAMPGGTDDGLPGRLLRAGAGPRGALAGDGRPGRPGLFCRALFLGLLYLVEAARFWLEASDRRARRLLRTSFVYLPAILLLLLLEPRAVLTSRR